MRNYITKHSSVHNDIEILNKCPKLTTEEINFLCCSSASSYIKNIKHQYHSLWTVNIIKLLKVNPELMELFI